MGTSWISASLTHQGKRSRNEDAFFTDDDRGIFIVADGMGGAERGDLASKVLIETASDFLKSDYKTDTIRTRIFTAVTKANQAILEISGSENENSPMGTTAVICLLDQDHWHIGWIGDSRAYLLRSGRLSRLTKDHSYVQALLDSGRISEDEAWTHPERNVITRAVGIEEKVEPDYTQGKTQKGDFFLLCTDGVHGVLKEEQITKIINNNTDTPTIARVLVDTVLAEDGQDNITALLIKIS